MAEWPSFVLGLGWKVGSAISAQDSALAINFAQFGVVTLTWAFSHHFRTTTAHSHDTPRRRLFFWNNLILTRFPRRLFGRSLCMPDANPPPTGFCGPISCSDAPPHPGPCHWAGEPAGRRDAESPSRRAAERASERKMSPPCLHRPLRLYQTHPAHAVS